MFYTRVLRLCMVLGCRFRTSDGFTHSIGMARHVRMLTRLRLRIVQTLSL